MSSVTTWTPSPPVARSRRPSLGLAARRSHQNAPWSAIPPRPTPALQTTPRRACGAAPAASGAPYQDDAVAQLVKAYLG
ncbi:MAG TPA: hypothetical protein VL242_21980, partial [Sorangium sp.]|nr:hypothetical protein [Sorangium sp.]